MRLSIKYILLLCCFAAVLSCQVHEDRYNSAEYFDRFNRYCRMGDFDSLALAAGEIFEHRNEIQDEKLVAVSTLNLAQAALSLDDFPLSRKYIDILDSNKVVLEKYGLMAMFNGVKAVYEVKNGFNYPQALIYYTEALNYYTRNNEVMNQCTALNNICMIYFFRRDTSGMAYAREALELSMQNQDKPYMLCMSTMTNAIMCILKEDYAEAERYALMAKEIADENGYAIIYSRMYMVLGEVEMAKKGGDLSMAKRYLEEGLEYARHSDNDFYYELSLPYARLLMSFGQWDEAEGFLKDMYDNVEKAGNIRYKYPILDLRSEIFRNRGEVDSAYRYYRLGVEARNSLIGVGKEAAFNDLLALYKEAAYENIIQRKQNNTRTAIFICVIILVTGLLFYVRLRMQNRSYKELVEKHQKYLQRNEMMLQYLVPKSERQTPVEQSSDDVIFAKLEQIMRKEHAYRQNEISLEKVAAMVGTNRTYISRIINNYANKTFYGYINMYRIEEATKILSDPSAEVQIKNLYSALGYNSPATFFRVFRSEVGCTPSKYREEVLRISSAKVRSL